MSESTRKYSINRPEDIAEEARVRGGPRGRQLERDNLAELVAVAEAEHGPVGDEEIQGRRETLRRLHAGEDADDPGAPTIRG